MFYQSVFIILGGLLSISEFLPFIDQTSANGIVDFLIQTFINQKEDKKSLHAPLLNYDDDILKLTDYICKISNENKDDLKAFILENSESLQNLLNQKLDLHKSSSDKIFSKLSEQNVNTDLTQTRHYNKLYDYIKEIDENLSSTIGNLMIKADINHENIQEILNKPSINNNDIVGVCEMILQHLQELQRKYAIQNNTLLETLNKYNNKEKDDNHDNYEQKIVSLLQELTSTHETINTVIKNHSHDSKSLELLQICLKNQEETNKHIHEIFNLLNKKKKMNLFFNNSNTSNTISSGSSSGTNGS